MKLKTVRIDKLPVACGGKRGKGCGSNWAGATTLVKKVKVTA